MSTEDAAKIVVDYLVGLDKPEHVQYTDKAGGFKIWSAGTEFPDNIRAAILLCTSSLSSTFKGSSNKVRTRFLDLKLLEDDDFENMMAMCDTLEDWLKQAFKKFQQKKLKFAHQMFTEIDEPRLVSSSSLSQGCIFFKLVHFLPQSGLTRFHFSLFLMRSLCIL